MGRRLNLWLLLIVILCVVSFWVGRGGRLSWLPLTPRTEPARGPGLTVDPEVRAVHLLILNGTDQRGLAREVSLLVPRAGCVAENIGNAPPGDHPVSLLVNRRLESDRALELADRLGGLPVLIEWDGRGTEDAVLLLGRDHSTVSAALAR